MKAFFFKPKEPTGAEPARPQLELSGPKLAAAFQTLVKSCEEAGGVERHVEALKFKSSVFREAFADKGRSLVADQFARLCMFMPTVRRRIGAYIDDAQKFEHLCEAMSALFEADSTDDAMRGFCEAFPADKSHRWIRDLAGEILHNCDPERQPLLCRWVWDRKANTGVLREIWHGDVDHITIDIDDDFETFLMLREELSQFLTANSIYRDVIWYVDLLCAQIYAGYVSSQGGSYLRTDFSSDDNMGALLRRIAGLDGVRAKSDRSEALEIDRAGSPADSLKLLVRH